MLKSWSVWRERRRLRKVFVKLRNGHEGEVIPVRRDSVYWSQVRRGIAMNLAVLAGLVMLAIRWAGL